MKAETATTGDDLRRLMLTGGGWQALAALGTPPPDWDGPPDPTGMIRF